LTFDQNSGSFCILKVSQGLRQN